ncbi:MAG: DUF1343 domain-containing protein [Bacteroidota bacterium]|nr:DUF1343 domain-containing protein [Bacteroidota bacterium]
MKPFSFFSLLFFSAPFVFSQNVPAESPRGIVKTGIDVLVENHFDVLQGKRIGLITNPTGVTSRLESTVDVLAKANGVKLVALFGPEHGVRGDAEAGASVESYVDSATGLPVYSLYGRTRKPTPEMLKNIDALVYDIQDIGVRSYTFISTMAYGMEAAAENNIEFIVLDRPDPLTGDKIEGNVLDTTFKSFVGMFPIPYVYGMTCGELATMINNEGWLVENPFGEGGRKCKLFVVKMKGWKRSMWWDETGLPWVPTSPHIPNAQTALYYAATGIAGELDAVNIGVGYTMPFQLFGTPWIEQDKLAGALSEMNLPGLCFRPTTYVPFYGGMKGKQVHGVQIYFPDRDEVHLVATQFYILQALYHLYPGKDLFALSSPGRLTMFDKVMGTDSVRRAVMNHVPVKEIIAGWESGIEKFLVKRKKYLLYE